MCKSYQQLYRLVLPRRRMTTSLNSQQYDGGVGIDGEGRQHHFVQDVILYPAQLLRQVPGRDEAADGGPLLAGRDELEGTLQGLLQVLQRAGHRRAVGHRPRLLQLRQDGAEPKHAPRDLAATSSMWRALSMASLIMSPILTILSTVATGSVIDPSCPTHLHTISSRSGKFLELSGSFFVTEFSGSSPSNNQSK